MEEVDVRELLKVVVKAAEGAARMLAEEFCSNSLRPVKGETIEADLESERAIYEDLKSTGLSFRMVSEESGVMGSGDYTFIVDPLDGSVNYEHCVPWSSVSVAVAPPGSTTLSQVVAGAVAPIFGGPTISFARGLGCFEGDREYRRPSIGSPRVLFVYVETPEDAEPIVRLVSAVRGLKIRSLGSSALEVAYTGMGRAYAFVDLRGKLRNVDIAAALGIARECNAVVINRHGEPVDGPIDSVAVIGDVIATSKGRLNELMTGLGLRPQG